MEQKSKASANTVIIQKIMLCILFKKTNALLGIPKHLMNIY